MKDNELDEAFDEALSESPDPDVLLADNEAEGERHLLARLFFLKRYLEQPEMGELVEKSMAEWAGTLNEFPGLLSEGQIDEARMDAWGLKLSEEILAFVRRQFSPKKYPPWLPLQLIEHVRLSILSRLFDRGIEGTITLHMPAPEIEFRKKPGESLEEFEARFCDWKLRVEKILAELHGKRDTRSEDEDGIERWVGWYFENRCEGRTHESIAAEAQGRKGEQIDRRKVGSRIARAEELLFLALPANLELTEE